MGYLICDKCEGYYELQKGERTGDFDKCRCGGDLRWVAKLPTQYQNEEKPTKTDEEKPKLIPCPDCGHKVSRTAKSCPNCGYRLTYEDKHGHTRSFAEIFGILLIGAFILQYFLGLIVWVFFIIMVLIIYYEKRKEKKEEKKEG